MCVTSGAVLKAQRMQLEADAQKKKDALKKKNSAKNKRFEAVRVANEKIMKGEVLRASDLKNVIMFVGYGGEGMHVNSPQAAGGQTLLQRARGAADRLPARVAPLQRLAARAAQLARALFWRAARAGARRARGGASA